MLGKLTSETGTLSQSMTLLASRPEATFRRGLGSDIVLSRRHQMNEREAWTRPIRMCYYTQTRIASGKAPRMVELIKEVSRVAWMLINHGPVSNLWTSPDLEALPEWRCREHGQTHALQLA